MNKIIWTGDRFECSSPELEEVRWNLLRAGADDIREFMSVCDLSFYDYALDDGDVLILHSDEAGKLFDLPIADEGAGFNICFHLGAYAIASMNLGQKLEICAYSFKPLLHPVLFQGLSKWFGDRPAQEIDKNCSYYSGDSTLKCAVNPSSPCKDCSDVSAGFNENLFVWRATELNCPWMQALEDTVMQGRGLDNFRQTFLSAQESFRSLSEVTIPRFDVPAHMLHPPINTERVMSRNISIGFSGDVSQVQEAIARLRRAGIPEHPFTEGTVGIDTGSGEDATAIVTGFTTGNGTVRINSLEIHADTSEAEAAIARMRVEMEIARIDHRLLGSYRCELSDRITLLPPERIDEEVQKGDAERRRRLGGW